MNVITLEISPDQAERLDLARNTSNLTLVLRNQIDKAKILNQDVPAIELGSTPNRSNPVGKVKQSPLPSIEVIRGTTRGRE